jgi:signal transduction histidine kinase/CheY-like chemotaxis protein/CHASE3 domain sensor protein
MNSKFLQNLRISFGISFFLLLLSAGAAFFAINGLVENQNQVEKTGRVLRTLENVISDLKDAETGQRGYFITLNKTFLEPYYKGKSRLPQSLELLKQLTNGNTDQQKNWVELNEIVSKRIIILDELLKLKLNNYNVSIKEMLLGKVEMDKCRALINQMKSIEETSLKNRIIKANLSASYTPALLVFSTLISLLITVVFYFRIKRDFKTREELKNELLTKDVETNKSVLAIEDIALKISNGNYSSRIERDDLGILSKISMSLNLMAESLENSFDKINDDEWLQKGIVSISEKISGNKNISEISVESINHLVSYSQCDHGSLYYYENGKLTLRAIYGAADFAKKVFDDNEGYIGQVFKSSSAKLIENIKENDYSLSFSSGQIKLKHLLFIPVIHEKITIGVIELGGLTEFLEKDKAFYTACADVIATTIISAKTRRDVQILLEQTQVQTEELQAQHHELENLNFELEAQTQKLKASEEELRVQQEELLESNQELEERAKLLEEKNQLIFDRNIEIQQKAEELALSTKYKSEFLANMSHELRTPLNSILLLSRLTAENTEGNLNEEQIESARVIQSSGNGLLTLIDEILDLSKIEAGKMEIDYEICEVSDLVHELEDLFKPLVKQKNITLSFELDKHVNTLETDPTKLNQILKNLLSNAIKFTSVGGVSLKITDADKWLTFEVKDTGIGISKDKQMLIFEAFQQEDGSTKRKFGGTGLGLSISRELVKLFGGQIKVESTPGKGSTFTVKLPKQKPNLPEIENIEEENEQETLPIYIPNPNIASSIPADVEDDRLNILPGDKVILIVEDDTVFAKALLTFARKENYKCIVIVRGDLALQAALAYKPRAILLDIQLPMMDGWMVMEQLKSNIKTKPIPVHIMSSLHAKKESLTKGAVDFINKPFAIEQLSTVFSKIEEALNKHPKKVLIVEENPNHANALSYFLSNFNITTEIKNTVEDSAVSLLDKNVDCVILDMGVPDHSGYATLEIIRKNKGLEKLPIIIFTGKNVSKVEERKLKKYADSIILKTAHSYQRILDEVGLFLHLVNEEGDVIKQESSFKKLGVLTEVIRNKTVLIADDDVRNIYSISKSLEKHQMNVISAMDGKDALAKLESNPQIDVVLMDIMMPELDGYETIKTIRKNSKYKKLPIIAVTSKAMMGDREKCISAGASDYISKPVDLDQLLSLLRVWLYQG